MINDYLYYGYLPPSSVSRPLIDLPNHFDGKHDYSLAGASEAFDRAVDNALSKASGNGCCVVPLSGGWDSRALLGAALERFPKHKIKTISFGAPGLLDFEIGGQIAKNYNLEHCTIDLSSHHITWKELSKTVKESPWTYTLSSHYNKIAYIKSALSNNDFVLSGFLGDVLTGGHLNDTDTKATAANIFVKGQRREKKIWLPQETYDPVEALPELPTSGWSDGEALDLTVRQSRCIAPIVTPLTHWDDWGGSVGELPSGASMLAPFADPEWAGYWRMAPIEMKVNKKLYTAMLKEKYPRLFAMPSKYSLGVPASSNYKYRVAKLKRQVQHHFGKRLPGLGIRYVKGENYLDFATAIRKRKDFQLVIQQAINYLKKNAIVPWIDLDLLYKMHLDRKSDYSRALMVLVGLALNIESNSTYNLN